MPARWAKNYIWNFQLKGSLQNNLKQIFEQAVKGRALEHAVIPTANIDFSPELYNTCAANACGNYNRCWTCPPAVGPLKTQKEKMTAFSSAFVFTTKSELDDSFDYEGMMRAKDSHNRLTAEIHERFGGSNPVYGAGACSICKTCAYPQPCRFPDKKISSIEAAGINVTELSRLGGLRYNNGENTVTYFSMILF
jgi:predicted metal-binding protein